MTKQNIEKQTEGQEYYAKLPLRERMLALLAKHPAGLTRPQLVELGIKNGVRKTARTEKTRKPPSFESLRLKGVQGLTFRITPAGKQEAAKLNDAMLPKNRQTSDESVIGHPWDDDEIRLLIANYFEMLQAELAEKSYSKSEHRRRLGSLLHGRTEGAIEFKHQNLSAVLVEMGLPYIEGYKPLRNKQSALGTAVEAYLDGNPSFLEHLATAPALNPERAPVVDFSLTSSLIVDPPENMALPTTSKPWLGRKLRMIDFVERDALNRKLGTEAEKFVLEFEKHRLISLGRDDLSKKVVWASRDIGDGLGFDIISYDASDDSERLIEVKATGHGKSFPFYITGNEVRCSEDVKDRYQLYRVFNFTKMPQFYILQGSLKSICKLEPILFRATL